MRPKVIKSKTIFEGRVFDLKSVQIQEGGLDYRREVIEHPGSAVVLPVHSNGEVSLVRQFRYPAGAYLLEIPAGTVEEGETPAECAARELEEETGLRTKRLVLASEFYVSPGFLTEKMHLFFAYDLTETVANRDDDENIEIVRMPLKTALKFVEDKSIIDAKTIIGILLASNTVTPNVS